MKRPAEMPKVGIFDPLCPNCRAAIAREEYDAILAHFKDPQP